MSNHLDLALERIATCRQTQSPSLDLTNLLIKELPAAVFELVWLEELNFSIQMNDSYGLKGFIHVIPNEIKQLTQLKRLILNKQSITDLSPLQGLKRLTWLECSETRITHLTPLQGLNQLQVLDCSSTKITDLSPLQGLNQLQALDCSSTKITDLSPLQGLNQLQVLDCSYTSITDLSPLQDLNQLQALDCWRTPITDLSPLQGLNQLQALHCWGTQITDLSPLQGLNQLQALHCWGTQITDLSPLQGLNQLQALDCWGTPITDLSPLQGLNQLQALKCSYTSITDLSPLQGLNQLQSLECSYTKITDLTPLQGLNQLQSLSCSDTSITDLSPLQGLNQLQALDCWRTPITDLSPLQGLNQLQALDCSATPITDLSPLQGLKQLQALKCSDTSITDLSPLLGLNQLQALDCWGTQITDLSPLQGLNQLQALKCSFTEITDLSPLQGLNQLQALECSYTKITDLSPLQGLNQLQALECSYTKITDLSPLQGLNQLQSLDCSYTPITDLSPLKTVTSLRELDISHTKITDLEYLAEHYLPYLSKITCRSNTIKNTEALWHLIPERERIWDFYESTIEYMPSVLLGTAQVASYSNLSYYFQALQQGFEWRRQLKIQLIGNGRVGKTSLAYALKHHQPAPAQMESTHGILIEAWPHIQQDTGDEITWQVWDFGGQEIYHATHRLFLSDDCVYLLVWAEDTEEQLEEINHPVSYWLEAIHDIAPNSPVILVKNQIDRADKLPASPSDLTLQMLGADQIYQAVKVSALQCKNMRSLKGTLQDVIEALKGRVYLKLPKTWLAVEAAINTLKQTEKTLSFEQFEQLCQAQQIDYAEWFVDYLHKTGMLFYQKGAFQNQIILDQNWIIEAVYKVFDRKAAYRNILIKHHGKLLGAETGLIWPDATEQEREIYLGFMRDCHICYEVNTEWDTPFVEREYIIPAFLPQQCLHQVTWGAMQDKDWHYVVDYPFLHRSIIERLIVRLGETYKDQSSPWYQGIYCNTEWGQTLLVCHIQDKTQSNQGYLQFNLRGASLERLLHALRKLVKEVSPHHRYSESLQKGLHDQPTPLPDFQEEATMSSRLDAAPEKQAIQVFISYSKEDKEHRVELEKRLKLISRQFKVKAWTDAQLMAGGLVHEDIKKELVNADVVLLLISPDFIATNYCYEIELPLALSRYQAKQNIVIPIIVRETPDWAEYVIDNFRLGEITALPTKGVPLEDWTGKDKFWADVQTGLKNRVKHLLEN